MSRLRLHADAYRTEFFEVGFSLMSDALVLHLGWWEFIIYRGQRW